ncbi:MAG TPA: glycosyltransferase family 2 protein [Pyrinomonadaceae bacterium]|nr:glycosyltransferase family 2 protein [Pyrinomonadaceae bacterium]
MSVFYFFAGVAILLGALSLRGGFRFAEYVRRELANPCPPFTPFVSLIAPCRGLDHGLRGNLAALFSQDYPKYEIIFVTDRSEDPSISIFKDVSLSETVSSRIVIAGKAIDRGQKVHNLTRAVEVVDLTSSVFVFADTDARPGTDWLSSLVAPLQNDDVGAASGYRWFLAAKGGVAAHLCAVWNASIASALGEAADRNFCWGGATAIRRETFDRLEVTKHWHGTVSDDFTLTRVLQRAKLPIQFVPECLTPSIADLSFRELVEFTTRQLKITRVYAPHLWKIVLIGNLLFTLVFFGGIALVLYRAVSGQSFLIPLSQLAIIFALGAAKSLVRLRAVRLVLEREDLKRSLVPHLLLWPFASLLFLYNALAAAFSRRISWRGIVYELNSPTEAVIISRD